MKWHFYLLLAALCVALLVAIAAGYDGVSVPSDFISCLVQEGEFPFWGALWLLVVLTGTFALLFVCCINFYCYFAGYIVFGIGCYFFIHTMAASLLCNGVCGIFYGLLFLFPLFAVWLYAYAMALYQLYRNVVSASGRCMRNLFRCNFSMTKRILVPFWALVVGAALVLWLVESLVLVLIF